MNAIAIELDEKLKTLGPAKAAAVERVVRDTLALAGTDGGESERQSAIEAHREHWKKMDQMFGELDWSDFERPPQGELETREEW